MSQATNESPSFSSRSTDIEVQPSIVLLIEDDDDVREAVRSALERAGHYVIEETDMAGAIHYLASARAEADRKEPSMPVPDVVLCDMHLPDGTGFDLLRALEEPVPVVMMTAYGDPDIHRLALRMGARRSLDKPVSLVELVEAIASVAR